MTDRRHSVRAPDRARTERALEDAALRLLEREGVLAGLNLSEVAHAAGLNRGLVYHYFGSRQALLRAALQREVAVRGKEVTAARELPVRQRVREYLKSVLRHRKAVELATLLTLDGDAELGVLALGDDTLARLREDVAAGDLVIDDVEAFLVVVISLAYGYALFRHRFAAGLATGVRALDDRVATAVDDLIAALVR